MLLLAAQITTAVTIPEFASVAPNQTFRVAVQVGLEEGWHSYWLNAGDSGSAPEFNWKLPKGWTVSPPIMPTPHKIDLDGMRNYGFEQSATVFFNMRAGSQGGVHQISADSTWMVCKDTCKMLHRSLRFSVEVATSRPNDAWAPLEAIWSHVPKPTDWKYSARRQGDQIVLRIGNSQNDRLGEGAYFFSEEMGVIDHSADQILSTDEMGQTLTMPISAFARGPIRVLKGVLTDSQRKVGVKIYVSIVSQ